MYVLETVCGTVDAPRTKSRSPTDTVLFPVLAQLTRVSRRQAISAVSGQKREISFGCFADVDHWQHRSKGRVHAHGEMRLSFPSQ
jgi:hypothetical protein